jgi:hypothetical protein
MSNRATRRASVAAFRRDLYRDHLLTHLIDADAPLDDHPLLSRAVWYWRGQIQQRRPLCPACRANFADGAVVAAFLFAMPATASQTVSVSAFCDECWRDLALTDIERISARVLSAVLPGGRFEPLEARR